MDHFFALFDLVFLGRLIIFYEVALGNNGWGVYSEEKLK